jgi:rod shape-determining protein MreC
MLLSKNRLIRRRAVIGLLVLAALALLSLSYRQGSAGVVGDIQRSSASATAPVTDAAHRVAQPFVDAWNWTTGLIHAREENSRLRMYEQQYSRLQTELQVALSQNARLRQLVQFRSTASVATRYGSVSGTVIQQSPDAYNGNILVDQGTSSGVYPDDPVIAPYSDGGALIGVVAPNGCTASTCWVRLITDQASGTGVTSKVLGSAASGSLTPSSGTPGLLDLELVPVADVVNAGQTVVTAALGGRLQALLPPGIPIGRVSKVDQNDAEGATAYKDIQVTPFVNFQDLSDVLVLKVRHAD